MGVGAMGEVDEGGQVHWRRALTEPEMALPIVK